MFSIEDALEAGLRGEPISLDQALELVETADLDRLCDAADEVRRRWCGDVIDTCSIVNGRSGRCSEDCKWCAQSRHHHTGIAEYDYIDHGDLMMALDANTRRGVMRFSLVTSGRRMPKAHLEAFCRMYRECGEKSDIYLCASMGLLDKDDLIRLKEAGAKRYHCNLETGESYFPHLCSSHSHADKLATIRAAREIGMEVCCGGIIGMGETWRQRLELACNARDAGAVSIPINILQPIPGTALADTPLISEPDVIRTVALFRFLAPKVTLRFAGGRARLSAESTRRILRGGMNGALVGDMLTTIGNRMDEDYCMFEETGFKKS